MLRAPFYKHDITLKTPKIVMSSCDASDAKSGIMKISFFSVYVWNFILGPNLHQTVILMK